MNILCDTNQMAYGSSSALLAIINYLPGRKTALAWGITEEILSGSPLVHRIIKINNKDNELVRKNIVLDGFDAVIVVSNLTNIDWYLDSGIPVFYVDLHHWYPTKKEHRIWTEGTKCFIERFFVEERTELANVFYVGPVITLRKKTDRIKKQVLVNIGGAENRWVHPGKNSDYIRIVLEILSEITQRFKGYKFILAAGRKSVESIKNTAIAEKFTIGTFSQDDYLGLLNESEYLITSPGLNAVFEGLYYKKKLIFLPPQNASQILQLKYYEKAGLVEKGLNLTEYFDVFNSLGADGFDEGELTFDVLYALRQVDKDTEIKRIFTEHIQKQITNVSTAEYFHKADRFISILGPPGAETVANTIMSVLGI